MSPRILTFPTPQELERSVARNIADRLASSSGTRPFLLGCPGGRSPRPVFAALAQTAVTERLNLNNLILLMMDDYLTEDLTHVPETGHYSCRRFARLEIQAVLNAGLPSAHKTSDANVWFPNPADPGAYDARIAQAGGIEIFLLASGAGDGHVAFNPPGTDIASTTRVVDLAKQTRRDNLTTFPEFGCLEEVPRRGITVGIAIIAAARTSAMLVWGEDKREAYNRLASARSYDPGWPATVWAMCPDATVYADLDATGGHT